MDEHNTMVHLDTAGDGLMCFAWFLDSRTRSVRTTRGGPSGPSGRSGPSGQWRDNEAKKAYMRAYYHRKRRQWKAVEEFLLAFDYFERVKERALRR